MWIILTTGTLISANEYTSSTSDRELYIPNVQLNIFFCDNVVYIYIKAIGNYLSDKKLDHNIRGI